MENRKFTWTIDRISLLSFTAYAVGVAWRFYYDFFAHRIENYIYSDMNFYHSSAKDILAGKVQDISWTVYPPGASYIYALLLGIDPSYNLTIFVQWLCSSLVPVMLFYLSWDIYQSRKVSHFVLGLSALYFPFVFYSSLMLSENLFLFFVVLSFWVFQKAQTSVSWGLALAAGILFGVAATIKSIALLFGIGLWGLYITTEKRWFKVGLVFLAGLSLVIGFTSQRCTKLNEGRFCVIANDFSRNVLLSHTGNTRIIYWRDHTRHYFHMFGNPQAGQRGYTQQLEYNFGVYDNENNIRAAWEWTKENPGKSFLASVAGTLDVFFGWFPWPSQDEFGLSMQINQIFFLAFIVLPGLFWGLFRRDWKNSIEEWRLLVPLLVLCAIAFLAGGEPRYRVPLDGFLMILGARYWEKTLKL